jgi:hypothetical protein
MKFKINKLLLSLLVLCGIAFFVFHYISNHKSYYITNHDRSLTFKIPDEIIRSKDCEKYQEFIHSLVAPTFVPDDRCPWPWDKVSAVAHFTMNGVKFEVPREYLYVGAGQPDGETTSINIQVQYPSMKPYHPKYDTKKEYYDDIAFSIDSSGTQAASETSYAVSPNDKFCKLPITENCRNIGQYYFREKIEFNPYMEYGKGYDADKPLKIEDMPDGTSLYNYNYKYKKGYEKEYYIKGNPLKPDYWVECYPPIIDANRIQARPSCEGVFNWDIRFSINYRFPREKLLLEQLQIKQKIEEKVKEFIVK